MASTRRVGWFSRVMYKIVLYSRSYVIKGNLGKQNKRVRIRKGLWRSGKAQRCAEMRTSLPILVVVLLGDSSADVEVSSHSEEETRCHQGSLTGTSTNDAGSKVGNPSLHYGLRKGRHGVGNVSLHYVGRVERSIRAWRGVFLLFNPVHGCRRD